MNNPLFPNKVIKAEEIRQMLRLIGDNRDLGHDEIFSMISNYEEASSRFRRHMAGTARMREDEKDIFLEFISKKMNQKEWGILERVNPDLTHRLMAPQLNLTNAMSHWLGSYLESPVSLRRRTGVNGNFLIIRLLDDDNIISSRMRIVEASVTSPLPRFVTYRHDNENKLHRVRGVFFKGDKLFYSFGRSRRRSGFRATILGQVNRSGDRFDMFGVRLGQQTADEFPFAYPIYCYQMKSKRSGKILKEIIGEKKMTDKVMLSEVKGLPMIIEKLKDAAASPMGVIADLSGKK